MISTGERYLPEIDGAYIAYEHWHRYLFATQFVSGKTVLDVASGEGYGSALLARSAAAVVGVDLDPEAVAHARRKYPRENLTFECGAAEAIPIPGQHLFDVIVSFETLEHIAADAQQRFAGEIKRLLKPEGRLLISTPNRLIYTDKNQHQNPFHLHEFSPDEFTAFLGPYFRDVRILCQRVYPGSYIWDEAGPTAHYSEYQLDLADGELQPVFADHKEKLYLIALCSQGPILPPGNSLLLDLNELATRGTSGKPHGYTSTLFVDLGTGFRAELCRMHELPPGPGPFRVSFTLDDLGAVQGLRWDPLESRTCRLRLDTVEWEDRDGQVHPLDPALAGSNGKVTDDGLLAFETLDPMVFLPVRGDVVRVTVAGWYEADDLGTSLACVETAMQIARNQLRERDEQLHDRDEQLRLCAEQLRMYEEEFRALTAALTAARQRTRSLLPVADLPIPIHRFANR